MARKTIPAEKKKQLFAVAQHKDDLPGSSHVYTSLEEALQNAPSDMDLAEGNKMYIAEVLMGSVHEYTLKLVPDICRRIPDSEVSILSEDLPEEQEEDLS